MSSKFWRGKIDYFPPNEFGLYRHTAVAVYKCPCLYRHTVVGSIKMSKPLPPKFWRTFISKIGGASTPHYRQHFGRHLYPKLVRTHRHITAKVLEDICIQNMWGHTPHYHQTFGGHLYPKLVMTHRHTYAKFLEDICIQN